ncbi:MAG: hypothetical protein V3S50_01335, partial [Acidobacteriota bacterium]
AVIISADKVMRGNDDGAPFSQIAGDHDLRVVWAKKTFEAPEAEGVKFLMSLLASNATASVATITAASGIEVNNRQQTTDLESN